MRNIRFVEGKIYHVYNRGVEKRNIFLDDEDRFRFVHDLFEFNDEEPAINLYYKKDALKNPNQPPSYEAPSYEATPSYEAKLRKIRKVERQRRKLIVKIMTFCLMPNHFHLLLNEIKEGGISEFMHKLGTGYTNYFNKKYERSGSLLQGPYKAVTVDQDPHLLHLPYYIHLNPLDLIMPEWREKEIKNYKKALRFLENYRWSSYPDYIGKKNFPSVTQRKFLLSFFEGPQHYKKNLTQWLKEINLEESGLVNLTLD